MRPNVGAQRDGGARPPERFAMGQGDTASSAEEKRGAPDLNAREVAQQTGARATASQGPRFSSVAAGGQFSPQSADGGSVVGEEGDSAIGIYGGNHGSSSGFCCMGRYRWGRRIEPSPRMEEDLLGRRCAGVVRVESIRG